MFEFELRCEETKKDKKSHREKSPKQTKQDQDRREIQLWKR